jgi:MSHA type pilus biogenesis protein MshL
MDVETATVSEQEPVSALARRYDLQLQSGDVRELLRALVKDTDIGLVLDAGVEGAVPVMDLKKVSLLDILDYVLPPLNLGFSWHKQTLRVFRLPAETRFFSLNYLSSKRKGNRQVSFSTRSGSEGGTSGGGASSSGGGAGGASGGGTGGGGQNQSSSQIDVTYENTIWQTFTDSMRVLVFGSAEGQPLATESSNNQDEVPRGFAFADSQGRRLIISPETGMVMVTAPRSQLLQIERFIDGYQGSANRQVWIEAKIVEVNLFKGYQMGLDWGSLLNRGGYYGTLSGKRSLSSPGLSFTPGSVESQSMAPSNGVFQFALSNNVIDFVLDGMARQGTLNVLASPRISTLNNEKAVIRVVREEAFFNLQTEISQGVGGNVTAPTINISVVPIGIVMDIVPQISENGDIMLNINPDISELLEVKRFEVQGALATQPVIDRRSIDTVGRVKDGQTLVLAGIIKERKNQLLKGVPFLYKIPLLGNLFRRTEQEVTRTELVIFITPRINWGRSASDLSAEEMQRIQRMIEPYRLGDTLPLDEGLRGELNSFRKKENQ